MKKILLYCLLQVVIIASAHGQYDNVWMLGSFQYDSLIPKCGINFLNGTPDTFSVIRTMGMWHCNASLCDTSSFLFCYSNGVYIANMLHDTLDNSKNYNPGTASGTLNASKYGLPYRQSVVFLPIPGNSNQIIVFNESAEPVQINMLNKNAPLYLKYSVIDMTLDSGLGGIIPNRKAINIVSDTLLLGHITACKHGNGRDWWVLVQKAYDTLFYKLLVTPDTIEVFPQQTGSKILYDLTGQAVFSPDGSKYVMLTQNKSLDVWDFDRCNGILTNYQHIMPPDTLLAYTGASISPNSRYLYICTNLRVYQYDFLSSNLDSSVQVVAINDSFPAPTFAYFDQHQIASDGKIYISTKDGCDVLHVIDQPDNNGLACNVLQHSIKLPLWNFSIPNHPNYNLGRLQGSSCDTLQWAGVQEQEHDLKFSVYPNPVTDGVLHIKYLLPQNKAGLLSVTDLTGKQVYNYRLPQWSTLQNLPIPLADGMYFCTISSNDLKVTRKFVLVR